MSSTTIKLREDIIAAIQLSGPLNIRELADLIGHPKGKSLENTLYFLRTAGLLTCEKGFDVVAQRMLNRYSLSGEGDLSALPTRKERAFAASLPAQPHICLSIGGSTIKLTPNDARSLWMALSQIFGGGA